MSYFYILNYILNYIKNIIYFCTNNCTV